DAELFEMVFAGGADVGGAGEPVGRLADPHVEAAAGVFGLGEQVGQAAVAGQGDLDVFVGVAPAAAVEILAAGLDVPEQDGDLPPVQQRRLAVGELPWQGQGGVLLVVGGDPGQERGPNRWGATPASDGGASEDR